MFTKTKLIEFIKSFLHFWSCVRILFILICFGWFCYNAYMVINIFIGYNTIVMVKYDQPDITSLPAFTICSNLFITDSKLMDKYPNYKDILINKNAKELREDLIQKVLKDKYALDILDN